MGLATLLFTSENYGSFWHKNMKDNSIFLRLQRFWGHLYSGGYMQSIQLGDRGNFGDSLVDALTVEGLDETLANEIADKFSDTEMNEVYDGPSLLSTMDAVFALLCLRLGKSLVDCPIAPSSGGQPGTVFLLIGEAAIEYDPKGGYMQPTGEMYIHDDAKLALFSNLCEKEAVRFFDRYSDAAFRVEWYTELLPMRQRVCALFGVELPELPGVSPFVYPLSGYQPRDYESAVAVLHGKPGS